MPLRLRDTASNRVTLWCDCYEKLWRAAPAGPVISPSMMAMAETPVDANYPHHCRNAQAKLRFLGVRKIELFLSLRVPLFILALALLAPVQSMDQLHPPLRQCSLTVSA